MSDDNDAPRKKGRDPILMVGTIVLVVAFVVVIGGYAYGELVTENKGPAQYGDTVKVNYVGSYYGYYIDDNGNADINAAIFDTSLWSVAKYYDNDDLDDKYTFSWEFTKKAENDCNPLETKIGEHKLLIAFENALIGMKPGDTKRITINDEDGYGRVAEANERVWDNDGSEELAYNEQMSVPVFIATFGLTSAPAGMYSDLLHPYGWKCDAVVNSDGSVIVTHKVVVDETYDNDNASMHVTISPGSDGSKFAMSFTFDTKADPAEGGIQLIQFKYEGVTYYITEIDDAANTFTTKRTDERVGMTLYFVITMT
ncbi:MAG: FKBP-type peptidyl-prolyl cis-trans isomerase [Methanomassiliicoccaceae archaeon]|nr:FKBP-type peptidyl-prolyl cis-trans isomerase [Methanomassiliicoccaceae archaeon]